MPKNKSLDGIKKLSDQDLKKARKIVLTSIGEEEKTRQFAKNVKKEIIKNPKAVSTEVKTKRSNFTGARQVDGISIGSGCGIKDFPRKDVKQKDALQEKEERFDKEKKQEEEEIKPLEELKQQKGVLKKASGEVVIKEEREELSKTTEKKRKPNKINTEKEKIKQKKISRKAIQQIQGKKNKKAIQQDLKQAEKQKRIIANVKNYLIAQAIKEKMLNIKIMLKTWKDRVGVMPNLKIRLNKSLKFKREFFIYSVLILAAFIIISYISFFVILINFNLDNNITRSIAKYLPVPALVTNIGIVEYYNYKDAENRLKHYYLNNNQVIPEDGELAKQVTEKLIKEIIINNLAKKYNLQITGSKKEQVGLREKIALKIVFDQEINYSILAKAVKIRQEIESGKNFYQIAKEYGDDFGIGKYYTFDEAAAKFGESAVGLEAGQVSDIIITNKGYYIIQCYGRSEKLIGLKYIFVNAKTLDDYIREKMSVLKIWSLVD